MIRSVNYEDFPAICGLIHEVHINPTSPDWQHFLIAITTNNEVIGCGQFKKHFDGSRELASIAVRRRSRGQGVTSSVIQELLTHETFRPVYLMCRTRLQSYYEKFGFIRIDSKEMTADFRFIHSVEQIINTNAGPEDRLQSCEYPERGNRNENIH